MSTIKFGDWINKHWTVLATMIVFIAGLWYSSKLHDYQIEELKSRIAKVEALDERLRNIELGVMELKTMVKQTLPPKVNP